MGLAGIFVSVVTAIAVHLVGTLWLVLNKRCKPSVDQVVSQKRPSAHGDNNCMHDGRKAASIDRDGIHGSVLQWRGVSCSALDSSGTRKPLLLNAAGCAWPGQLHAIIGPSGDRSGMHALSMRTRGMAADVYTSWAVHCMVSTCPQVLASQHCCRF